MPSLQRYLFLPFVDAVLLNMAVFHEQTFENWRLLALFVVNDSLEGSKCVTPWIYKMSIGTTFLLFTKVVKYCPELQLAECAVIIISLQQ